MTAVATADLRAVFREFSRDVATRSPLYARLAAGVADQPDVIGLLADAPAAQQRPVLLFAAVHDLLLRDPRDPLAGWYPDLTDQPRTDDPVPEFVRLCRRHAEAVRARCATRSTQTNEVGRCAYLVPPLGLLATEVGALALVDVGCSAGLNLLPDRYSYDYGSRGTLAPEVPGPAPVLTCGTRGPVPVPRELPTVSARLGLDRAPIDVRDEEASRWLRACVWPDQLDRLRRLEAAIEVTRREPPEIVAGDAVDTLAPLVEAAAARGHPVVMTSWVLTYLDSDRRRTFVEQLDDLGRKADVSWVIAESPELVPEVPIPPGPDPSVPGSRTAITLVTWRGGRRTVERLGIAHPHGYWLHWRR